MYHHIRGTLCHTEPNLAVVEAGGIGFAIKTSARTLGCIQGKQEVTLYTQLNVREDAMELFGFFDMDELNCFRLLTGISGVGPKAALSILSSNTPERVALGIISGDEKMLTNAPGVGKKLASRIILELKDKLSGEQFSGMSMPSGAVIMNLPGDSADSEAISALKVLGYSAAEAAAAVKGIDPTLPSEEIIRLALRQLVR